MCETLFIDDVAALQSIYEVVADYASGRIVSVFALHPSDEADIGKYGVLVDGPHQMFNELAKLPAFATCNR